ncbi:hypothetical protein BJV82DRAFT_718764 [Fennellomyces sp. T-0311]|nr:hypothetical protein BJV82DRAFT_718764 [Fennellomyces sp. T-0311]
MSNVRAQLALVAYDTMPVRYQSQLNVGDVRSAFRFGAPSSRVVDYPALIRPLNVCCRCYCLGKACHGFHDEGDGLAVCGQCKHDRKQNCCGNIHKYLANTSLSKWHIQYLTECQVTDRVGLAVAMPMVGYGLDGRLSEGPLLPSLHRAIPIDDGHDVEQGVVVNDGDEEGATVHHRKLKP